MIEYSLVFTGCQSLYIITLSAVLIVVNFHRKSVLYNGDGSCLAFSY